MLLNKEQKNKNMVAENKPQANHKTLKTLA